MLIIAGTGFRLQSESAPLISDYPEEPFNKNMTSNYLERTVLDGLSLTVTCNAIAGFANTAP